MTEIKDKVITKDAFALPYTIIKAKNQPTKGAIVYIHGGGLMLNRLVEQDMSKPVAEMISTYTTQIDNAMALNEEFDLLALRKSVIRWCELLLTNKPMALIGIIDLLKQAKNKKLQSLTIAAVNGFFEDIIHTKVNVEDKQIYSDLKNDIDQYAQKLSFNQLILMFDQLTEAHKKLNQNVNPTLVFEQIVIKGVS